ncbi:MAG: hypothetical protein M1817_004850 [Caeruleum heppii]|nr:MAG: hypothetical protein M1817_004850 [Caeruleum heppii]
MSSFEDSIAATVHRAFDALPTRCKPRPRPDGTREWVPLSGIVLARGREDLTCASLGTGMACLPQKKVSLANGGVLHDWHAEVLAIRSFNRFMIQECLDLIRSGHRASKFLRHRADEEISTESIQPFTVKEGTSIHMYCSEAPCGDASMELTMAAQDDPTPWATPSSASTPSLATSPLLSTPPSNPPLHGRGYFSHLGIVRRKPSRPDAPPTFSKSCTDKLALRQCTSLLLSPTSLLISPENVYLDTLILPESQFVPKACERAFSATGRMKPVADRRWGDGYRFAPFDVRSTSLEFAYSRRSKEIGSAGRAGQTLIPSNISTFSTSHHTEVLINGVLQGRKQFDPRGASQISRRNLWRAAVEVGVLVGGVALQSALRGHMEGDGEVGDPRKEGTYAALKKGSLMMGRREVKRDVRGEALSGWVENGGDEGFVLEEDLEVRGD